MAQFQRSNFKSNIQKLKVYFIGIKGAGMSGLALIYKKLGAQVIGSDIKEEFFSDAILKKEKIKVLDGFNKKNLPKDIDLVVVSKAFMNNQNPEYQEAILRGYNVLSYPEAVAIFFNQCYGIAISGSHGKTTVSAMVGEIIKQAQQPLIALVGSKVLNWQSNAIVEFKSQNLKIEKEIKSDKMPFFVLEADEYQEAFLNYEPKILLITNIDWDHPDYFKKEIDYIKAFEKMIKKTIACGGKVVLSKNAQKILDSSTVSFGKISKNLINIYNNENKFKLKIAGDFNQYNANGAYTVAKLLNIRDNIIKKALSNFSGTARRMEQHNIKIQNPEFKIQNLVIIDDYAHHPTEIKETIKALKQKYKKKIWLFFQPHTFSRTKAYLNDFVSSLKLADKVSIVETFGSAREQKGFSAKNIVKKIKGSFYHQSLDHAAKFFVNSIYESQIATTKKSKVNIFENYLIVTMGAGDVWKIRDLIVKFLKSKSKNDKWIAN